MHTITQQLITTLRFAFGILFFYAGITKVFDPTWSAGPYLLNAKTFSSFYQWLAQPDILPFINTINEWGLVSIGVLLLVGIGVRFAGYAGALLMLLYYFPILTFPYAGHGFIIEEHIIYAIALLIIAHTPVLFGLRWHRKRY